MRGRRNRVAAGRNGYAIPVHRGLRGIDLHRAPFDNAASLGPHQQISLRIFLDLTARECRVVNHGSSASPGIRSPPMSVALKMTCVTFIVEKILRDELHWNAIRKDLRLTFCITHAKITGFG